MKKITSIVPLLFAFGLSKAQIVPNNGGVPTATQAVATVPSAYSNTIKLNVVRTWETQISLYNQWRCNEQQPYSSTSKANHSIL